MAEEARLKGKLSLDDSQFSAALRRSEANAKKFASTIGGIGKGAAGLLGLTVSVGGLAAGMSAAISRGADLAGRMADLSAQTRDTAGNLSLIERALKNTGAGAEAVNPTFARMHKLIGEASQGTSGAVAILDKLGLTAEQLGGQLPTEQLGVIASRIANIKDPSEQSAVAIEIFGKSGMKLIPFLTNFKAELANAKGELGSLPEILNQSADSIDNLGDKLEGIKEKLGHFGVGFLSKVGPELEKMFESLAGTDAAGAGAKAGEFFTERGKILSNLRSNKFLQDQFGTTFGGSGNEYGYALQLESDRLYERLGEIDRTEANARTKAAAMAGFRDRIQQQRGAVVPPVDFSEENERAKSKARLGFILRKGAESGTSVKEAESLAVLNAQTKAIAASERAERIRSMREQVLSSKKIADNLKDAATDSGALRSNVSGAANDGETTRQRATKIRGAKFGGTISGGGGGGSTGWHDLQSSESPWETLQKGESAWDRLQNSVPPWQLLHPAEPRPDSPINGPSAKGANGVRTPTDPGRTGPTLSQSEKNRKSSDGKTDGLIAQIAAVLESWDD